jgi:hypothetical protein
MKNRNEPGYERIARKEKKRKEKKRKDCPP